MEHGYSVHVYYDGFDPSLDEAIRKRIPDSDGSGYAYEDKDRDISWSVNTRGDVDKLYNILFAEFPALTRMQVFVWENGRIVDRENHLPPVRELTV